MHCRCMPRSHPQRSLIRRNLYRDWYSIAEKPAPALHLAHPEGCAALRILLVAVPRVRHSFEHFSDGFDLHLLQTEDLQVPPALWFRIGWVVRIPQELLLESTLYVQSRRPAGKVYQERNRHLSRAAGYLPGDAPPPDFDRRLSRCFPPPPRRVSRKGTRACMCSGGRNATSDEDAPGGDPGIAPAQKLVPPHAPSSPSPPLLLKGSARGWNSDELEIWMTPQPASLPPGTAWNAKSVKRVRRIGCLRCSGACSRGRERRRILVMKISKIRLHNLFE